VPNGGGVRVIIDTNVLLSGLIWRGPPHALIEQVRTGLLRLVSSPALMSEIAVVIGRAKFRGIIAQSDSDPRRILAEMWIVAEIVDPPALRRPISRDPDDYLVLALAVAAHPDLIVSGDRDLLVLGTHGEIPIVTPAQALAILGADMR
jgi:uncharacterized protein